jgi:hypothetical protein
LGKRTRAWQPTLWFPMTDLRTPGSHPFNQHLNERLCAHGFDDFVEAQCAGLYADGPDSRRGSTFGCC